MTTPQVSVLTPTYNRRLFFPRLIQCYEKQVYPKENMEWIILDDGTDSIADLIAEAALRIPHIRYIRSDVKMPIGEKRNRLNECALGEILVCMDDDDYYPPERVSYVVDVFQKYPRASLAGCSELPIFYPDQQCVYPIGPFHCNHATNNTMAYRKSYLRTHSYDSDAACAEESWFTNDFSELMIQLHPAKTIVVIAHATNTVDKRKVRSSFLSKKRNPARPLSTWITDPEALAWYAQLTLA